MKTSNDMSLVKSILAAAFLLMILSGILSKFGIAQAEELPLPTDAIITELATQTDMTGISEGKEAMSEPSSEPEATKKPRRSSKRQPMLYDIPQDLLDADPVFAAIMEEAEKYIGYPYVYGGSKPSTSFDCSGFVSWVYTQSGACNTGRKGANGLHRMCEDVLPEDARPGDLIFFHGTMGPEVKGITHVGIYVGNNMMIHCGDPIGYVDLTDEKWVKRFDCYGRLPLTEGVPHE